MPPDRGKDIRPGMSVHVEPTQIAREEFGAIIGKVAAISEFPVTPQGMAADLHNETLVKRFSEHGAPYAAKIQLEPDASTVSGYRWSSGKGPPVRLSSGTLTRAEVTTREQRRSGLLSHWSGGLAECKGAGLLAMNAASQTREGWLAVFRRACATCSQACRGPGDGRRRPCSRWRRWNAARRRSP